MAALGLTWFRHRRTTELCAGLGIELLEITTLRRGLVRYALLTIGTVRELSRRKPSSLLVQNPSLILAVLTVCLRPWFRYRLLVDAHNEGVEPYINRAGWIVAITRWVLRKADVTIVTNSALARIVEACGGRAFILPDRIPHAPDANAGPTTGSFKLALIATFAPDEPVENVFAAVRDLDLDVLVTGNFRKLKESARAAAPANIKFTGFLSEADYWSLLYTVDAIIDLTTMDNCLVCGAYEAVAVGKPLVLTRSEASIDVFGSCAVFTDNSVADIRRAIEVLRTTHTELSAKVAAAKHRMLGQWDERAVQLRALLKA